MPKIAMYTFLIIAAVIVTICFRTFTRFKDESRTSEAKTLASAVAFAETAYHEKFHRYAADLRDAGIQPEPPGHGIIVAASVDALPPEFKKLLIANDLPKAENEEFQVLVLYNCLASQIGCAFVVNQTGVTKKQF